MQIVKLEGGSDMTLAPSLASKSGGFGQATRNTPLPIHGLATFRCLRTDRKVRSMAWNEQAFAFLLSHATPAKMAKGCKPPTGLPFQLKRAVFECSHMFLLLF